jgi:DNA-binding CsgD family transcriptional regulator
MVQTGGRRLRLCGNYLLKWTLGVLDWIAAVGSPLEDPVAPLSPREVQVLRLIARDYPTKEIASELGISERTVKWHVAQIFAKVGASTRAGAVARAIELRLLNGRDQDQGPTDRGAGHH